MKARTDLFGRCRGCGRRLKRKSTTCSRLCELVAGEIGHRSKPSKNRHRHLDPSTGESL
ncbi:hypothetical protein [Thiomonas sp.]|uniref:hypothetical protein n=1 Tax=Thiomonas sp. TaxID=2047785 RepID=UPI00258624FB|nr:hypothetical protein [Thiomonas sp.]